AKVAKPANREPGFSNFSSFSRAPDRNFISEEDPDGGIYDERAALIEHEAGAPRDWAEGFATLNLAKPPEDIPREVWDGLLNDGGRFIDRWAAQAKLLGWSAADVLVSCRADQSRCSKQLALCISFEAGR